MKRIVLLALVVIAVSIAVILAVILLPSIRQGIANYRHIVQAASRAPAAEADWRKEFGDPAEMLARFPRREDDARALQLIDLAHSIDVDIARPKTPRGASSRSNPDRGAAQAVADYCFGELLRTHGNIAPPPQDVQARLDVGSHGLDIVVEFLSGHAPPAWKSDVAHGPEAPVPNLLGHLLLQRLLAAHALRQASRGDYTAAGRTLDASWTLNRSLWERAEEISQLTAVAVARMHVGLLRRIPADPVLWRGRVWEHDFRASLLRAIITDTSTFLESLPRDSSLAGRALRADYLDLQRKFIVTLRNSPVSDDGFNEGGHPSPALVKVSVGAIIASMRQPNDENAVRRVDRLIVDTELTDRILQARIVRAKLGHWPSELPGVGDSRLVNARWIYAVGPHDRLTISLSRELDWGRQLGPVLPLRYESEK